MRVSIIFLLLIFSFACSKHKKKSERTGEVGLPTLMIHMQNGEMVMTNNLQGKLILIFFSPNCDHCKRQAESIKTHIDDFKDYSLYFLAGIGTENDVEKFVSEQKLKGYPNIFFGTVAVEDVFRILGEVKTPSIFVYSESSKLIEQFDGETPIDEILEVL